MLAPPATYNQRDDLLEVTILDAINLPPRKDGSPRQPFFSAQIPNTEQRWQQSSPHVESGRSSHPFNQTFYLSVAERLDHSIRLSLWDRKPALSGGADHHDKLLGECGMPLPYIGWKWVDAKLKLKPADSFHESELALSYVRAKLRFTKEFKSGGRSGEITVEDVEEEQIASPKNGSAGDRKKFWRHTRELGKRSPSSLKHNEFLMSAEIRTVGEDADIDKPARTARQELLLSQPIRTISINASDSSSDDSEDDRPSAKSGGGLTRRLSRDLTKLRQLLTYEDRGSAHQQQQREGASPAKGSPGKKFWTIGRQSEASLEVSQSADSLPSVKSIDWQQQSRTFSDADVLASGSTVSKKKNEKKGKGTLTKKERKKVKREAKEQESGSSESVKKVKVKKDKEKKKSKKKGGGMDEIEREESWERDDSDRQHQLQQQHLRSQEGMESGVVLAVIAEEESSAGTEEDSLEEGVASAEGSVTESPPEEGGLRQMKPKKGKEEEAAGEAKKKKNKKEKGSKKSTSPATP